MEALILDESTVGKRAKRKTRPEFTVSIGIHSNLKFTGYKVDKAFVSKKEWPNVFSEDELDTKLNPTGQIFSLFYLTGNPWKTGILNEREEGLMNSIKKGSFVRLHQFKHQVLPHS